MPRRRDPSIPSDAQLDVLRQVWLVPGAVLHGVRRASIEACARRGWIVVGVMEINGYTLHVASLTDEGEEAIERAAAEWMQARAEQPYELTLQFRSFEEYVEFMSQAELNDLVKDENDDDDPES